MKGRFITTGKALLEEGLIAPAELPVISKVSERYSVSLSRELMDALPEEPIASDPVAMQYVPDERELQVSPNELKDPIGDDEHTPMAGLIHRYPDRVLLQPTLTCPVYCRFCFRKEKIGAKAAKPLSDSQLDRIFDYLAAHEEVWEVILSGGDPLAMSPRRIGKILDGLEKIEHVRVVRFHSRVPVAAPGCVTDSLLEVLTNSTKSIVIVLHANHRNEFMDSAKKAIRKVRTSGITMLSQTVMLRGINDSVEDLSELMRTFVEHGVVPYYLHHLDRAPGTSHFHVPIAKAHRILRELRGHYSGLCQPTYVVDLPGGFGKSPIGPNYLEKTENAEGYVVTDYNGAKHPYDDWAAS